MIKGITLVSAAGSAEEFERLGSFFGELGFEPGNGWENAEGKGSAFLAPLGNIEFVTGLRPAVPAVLIEATQLDALYEIAKRWMLSQYRTEEVAARFGEIEETHWKSRMFVVEPVQGTKIGFWERTDAFAGRPAAVEGDLSAVGMTFAIVVARWNAVITDRLLQGALDALVRSGAAQRDIEIVRVPGAWEIPSAARTLAEQKSVSGKRRWDGIITLGVLLRGETAHYEAIYNEVSRGIGQSQQETGVPHAFGVLTCETLEQALNRAGLKAGNKGFEAAVAVIEMVSIQQKLQAKHEVAG